ncbi:MAG: hypothetical protein GYA55_14085 [SAR324 cluster bacterium]|uniref:Uncharacterized protein n=1 Tax=SAR324 cluster bacterium TaxID=2024889 RepID=A0A7X9ILL3_9DELT|nr:hypothetical protein [SAR324 cluster bacterium]
MIINRKRIFNLKNYLPPVLKGKAIAPFVYHSSRIEERLKAIGFTQDVSHGEMVLPTVMGPISRYNAQGRQIVRRDLPKETASRQVEWHWIEWHGKDRVERSDICDLYYERYPRDFLPPPSLELRIVPTETGQKIITTTSFIFCDENNESILLAINLFLEIFGECEISVDSKYLPCLPQKKLNWTILPRGKRIWPELKTDLKKVISSAPRGNWPVIEARFYEINNYGPDFVAIGDAGFRGYLIFGFPNRNLYLLESAYFGNATYVFENDWETLSKLTKAEILNEKLQKDRIIHIKGWEQKVKALLLSVVPTPLKQKGHRKMSASSF